MLARDDHGLDGKAAIVTGGGSRDEGIGNGRAAAILLARAGARVLVVDQTTEAAALTVKMIEDEGGEASAFAADVTKSDDCKAMVAAAMDRYGRLDVLDNNVGISSRGSVVEEREEVWENLMKVNVTAMFLAAKHAVPAMIESGDGGAIVNISSISALRPRGLTAYTTTKGAVIALTRAMAIDHGPDGIRANCIAPGPVYTPMVYTGGMSDEAREARRNASVMGMEGTGWDIGEAVLFLASARARFITGQTLVVDGGATLVGPKREYRGG
ncbi:MAG: glucose 1-dehydrogenase [Alphaproteobacteria bacterium]|jgi:NAD(P)-dependent dehydrogenase (short-subunit alcohol dehydrogenase family)|nr:glucose 1-dehydrogenase [Alphaproteobacteria bacterium]